MPWKTFTSRNKLLMTTELYQFSFCVYASYAYLISEPTLCMNYFLLLYTHIYAYTQSTVFNLTRKSF